VTEELLEVQEAFRRKRKDDPRGLVHQYAVATGLGTNVSKSGLLTGDVALAAVVRANSELFEDGRKERPGVVVHSRDRLVWDVPEVLTHCVQRLLKSEEEDRASGVGMVHPWSRLNVECATRDDRRPINMDIAPQLCDGFDLQLSSILFQRALLPRRKLVTMHLPVIAPTPGGPSFVPFVVHESCWPEAWKEKGGA
jgi:hypothetical protein